MKKPQIDRIVILWEYDPKADHNKRFVKKKVLVDGFGAEIEEWIETRNYSDDEWVDSDLIPGRAVSTWDFISGVSLRVFNPPIDFYLFCENNAFHYRDIIGGYEMAIETIDTARDLLANWNKKKRRK